MYNVLIKVDKKKNSIKIKSTYLCSLTCSYIPVGLTNGLKADAHHQGDHVEMTSMLAPINDLDHTPFRSLRPRSQVGLSVGGGSSSPRAQRVCSVAPNLPTRPPSCSDNDSIRKNRWDMDYEGKLLDCFFSSAFQ